MNTDDGSGLFGLRPILCVESVARSIQSYVESLGFRLGSAWRASEGRFPEPGGRVEPSFAHMGRGHVQFMLVQKTQGVPGMWLHLDVHTADQLDALYEEWTRRRARIVEPPSLRLWGMYEMRVRDLDNHMLRVSAPPRTIAE